MTAIILGDIEASLFLALTIKFFIFSNINITYPYMNSYYICFLPVIAVRQLHQSCYVQILPSDQSQQILSLNLSYVLAPY